EIWILENSPDLGSIAAGQEPLAGGVERVDTFLVIQRLFAESLVNDEAARSYLRCRAQHLLQVLRSPVIQCALPSGQSSGYSDRHTAGDQFRGEVIGLARCRVDESIMGDASWCGLAAVDGADLAGLRIVVEE